jgi:DNA-binding NtrC family response regulator
MGNENETTEIIDTAPYRTMRKVVIRLLFTGDAGLVNATEYELGPSPVVVGRLADNGEIRLTDPGVSRRHARMWCPPNRNGVVIEDMSTNGSSVNAQKVTSAFMNDGDILRVGNSFFVVRCYLHEPRNAEIPDLVGISPEMGRLRAVVTMVAPTEATALIIGESGTGKELVARAIHRLSGRKGAFVPVNCAAIPTALAESQLFGHVAGSFTGAQRNHDGYFRQADGGTLFLDEVGELPLDIQPKLLRVLEDRAVTPVGDVRSIPLDIRIVAATNRNLEEAIGEQCFRGDLFARLAELTLNTPPLWRRREDILPLFELGFGPNMPSLSPELVESLLLYRWPFNVRELFKVARECKIQSKGAPQLDLRHIEHRLRPSVYNTPVPAENIYGVNDTGAASPLPLPPFPCRLPSERITVPPLPSSARGRGFENQMVSPYEPALHSGIPGREQIENALQESRGNISHLSRILGRSRRQVYRYLEMYDLDLTAYRE